MAHIIIRDGRVGRDESLVTEAGGQILHEYEGPNHLDGGLEPFDRITLPSGEIVEVLYKEERVTDSEYFITVTVGDAIGPGSA